MKNQIHQLQTRYRKIKQIRLKKKNILIIIIIIIINNLLIINRQKQGPYQPLYLSEHPFSHGDQLALQVINLPLMFRHIVSFKSNMPNRINHIQKTHELTKNIITKVKKKAPECNTTYATNWQIYTEKTYFSEKGICSLKKKWLNM